MNIFIILPCYNEENSLQHLLLKITAFQAKFNKSVHVVAVNDGSDDKTDEVLKDWSVRFPMTIITHKINRGLGETIRDGMEAAAELASKEDIIVRMDADNTHEPAYIPLMISKINDGYDVAIASRFQKGGGMEGVGLYRTLVSLGANAFMKLLFPIKGVWDYSCGFRAYKAALIKEAIGIYGDQFIGLKGLGFTCTLEKIVKLRLLGALMGEVPFILRYDQKVDKSKMISSITTVGYLMLAILNIYP
ncbi:MAG: glycosyltransferase family 2 protein, partial [Deltaproteobacteria bacterium]|nr:glycosyltransferase family 2 protein [Deltaproteobacteria bacterium]